MILSAWLLVLLAPAAGWLLWTRLPARGEQDDILEALFAAALCAVYLVGCSALLLAELGMLRPPALAASIAVAALALWRLPRQARTWTRPSRADAASALFVAVLAAAVLAPASEDLLGGRDGGTYANTAVWLAREGTLEIRSDALASTTGEWRRIFHASVLFPGFYIVHAASGQLAPQFLHLHPVYMAIGAWLGGLEGLFLVPPLFGTLAALAVFFFVRRTLGVAAGVIAASVLALNLAQIWGARNPYSEPATQMGVFAALWCVAAAHATGALRWGVLGGIALGSCALLRIDAPMMLLALLPALVLLAGAAEQPPRWLTRAFLPATLLFAIWGAVHGWLFSRPYVTDLARLAHPLWLASAAVAVVSMAALATGSRLRGAVGVVLGHGRTLWATASALICAAFVFGMWIRPSLGPFAVRPSGMRTYVEETLVRVGWYFSPVGMLLALAGLVLLLRRALVLRRVEWLPFLALFFFVAGLYFWNPRIYPDHPWMMRRFLPVVVPALCVAVAAAVTWLWTLPGRWRLAGRAIAAAVLTTVVAHEITMAAPFATLREKAGLTAALESLSRRIPETSLLLFSRPGPEAGVATPLALTWTRQALPVVRLEDDPRGERRRSRFEAQVLEWLREGRDILYLTADDGDAVFLTHDVRWEEADRLHIDVPTFGVNYEGPPREPQRHRADYRILRAVSAIDDTRPCAGTVLHAGGRLGNVMQGFYGAEATRRERFHWASPDARVVFPSCRRTESDRPETLRVRASCGRTAPPEECAVRVSVNGIEAGRLRLASGFADHDLSLPTAAVVESMGPIEVRFRGPQFLPDAEGSRRRELSFQLQEVALLGSQD